MLENYYLLGLPINLTDKQVGIIHQPTYRELVDKKINMDTLLKPFLMKKEMMKGESDEFNKILDSIGNLGFLYLLEENSLEEKIIDNLIYSLKIFYETDDVYVNPNTKYIHVSDIVIDIEKFDIISTVILEMFKVDPIKFENTSKMDEVDKEFARKRKEYEKKTKKTKNELGIVDIVNLIIHTNECGIDYNKVSNMTIYQIKNTYEVLMYKYNFEEFIQWKMHQFDTGKMKAQDWKIKKIVKNSAIKME